MKFFNWILNHPVTISMFFIAMLIIGVVCFTLIPIELSPRLELPKLSITAHWPNTSALTVETQVTAPLESAAQRLHGVRKITSSSYEGFSSVTIDFEKNSNIQLAELELNESINRLKKTFPAGVSWPVITRSVPEEMHEYEGFMRFQLIGDQNSSEIRRIAQERLLLPLSSIQGVEHVSIQGGDERYLTIELYAKALLNYHITKADRARLAAELRSRNIKIGTLQDQQKRADILASQSFTDLDEIRNIAVKKQPSGRIIKLSDIAEVTWTSVEPSSIIRINGRNLVAVALDKEPGVNMLETAQRVDQKIAQLENILPQNMQIIKELDKSQDLKQELDKLGNRSLLSILFIAIVLALVFRKIKTSLVILGSIFLSVLGAVSLFYFTGNTLNILTIAGFTMGFGILVDNAIVVYDHIHRKRSELLTDSKKEYRNAVIAGSHEMLQPLLASNLTTLGAFVPIFFLSPDLQMYFKPFAFALGSTIIFSLFISFTIIPIFSYYWLPLARNEKGKTDTSTVSRYYMKMLQFCTAHPVLTIIAVIWLFGFPIWLLPTRIESEPPQEVQTKIEKEISDRKSYESLFAQQDTLFMTDKEKEDEPSADDKGSAPSPSWLVEKYNRWWGNDYFSKKIKPILFKVFGGASFRFFREVDKGEIWKPFQSTYIMIRIQMPNGIHISRIDQICQEFENLLVDYETSLAKVTTRVHDKTFANIRIDITKAAEKTALPMRLYTHLVQHGLNLGGIGIQVTGFGPGFHSSLENSMAHYSVKVTGTNFNHVYKLAEQFAVELTKNKRIKNIDLENARRYGHKQYEVAAQTRPDQLTAFQQDNFSLIHEMQSRLNPSFLTVNLDRQMTNARIQIKGNESESIRNLSNTLVRAGSTAREYYFSSLLDFEKHRILPVIRRENQSYIRLVNYDYIGPRRYGAKHQESVIENMDLPYGYSMDSAGYFWFGDKKQQRQLLWIILLSIFIVWMISAALFESFTKPFLILLAIPLSLIGLFYSFYLLDATFDQGGYASILLLVGIVVNNSIILVSHISNAIQRNGNTPTVIFKAASERIRPIFMTTLTTIVGLLPLVLYETTESIWYPIAVGTIGGLIGSSILIAIFIPLLYNVWIHNT